MREVKRVLAGCAENRQHRNDTRQDDEEPAKENQPEQRFGEAASLLGRAAETISVAPGESHQRKADGKHRRRGNMQHQGPMRHWRMAGRKSDYAGRGQNERADGHQKIGELAERADGQFGGR